MSKAIHPVLILNLFLISLGCATPVQGSTASSDYTARTEIRDFIKDLVKNHGFNKPDLTELFANVERQDRVLDAIARPAEAKPWHQYRDIFITPKRIAGGVQFWNENKTILRQAEHVYGIPINIIVAIIGVETFYGRRMGKYPVLDTLTTLGFDYPPRSSFFRSELEHFLLLAREESLDLSTIKGSYAGAMGQGQFIPSSFRRYAVDFDADGKRDLWHNNADAIGSVANYFKRHGWQPGSPVALSARTTGNAYKKLLGKGMKPSISPATLSLHGISPEQAELSDHKVAFFEFELQTENQYWIGLHNFYVITRYNHSPLYAMAVYQLSQEIAQARKRNLARTP